MDIGIKKVELIPYKNFKEKIRLTKQYRRKRIEVYDYYILIF